MLGITTIRRHVRASRVPKDALKGAAAFARGVSPSEVDAMRQRLEEVTRIQEAPRPPLTFLPIEQMAKRDLQKHLDHLADEGQRLKRQIPFVSKYKQLSLEPLSWRDHKGLPRLVVFRLDSPDFVLEGRSYQQNRTDWWSGDIQHPQLPKPIYDCYSDVCTVMMRRAKRLLAGRYGTITLTCHFAGLIPIEVKQKINKAREDFGDEIFIIGEVKGWKEEVHADPDPLVVGWDGGSLWLIDMFDVTSIEQAMALYPTMPTDHQA